MISENLENIHSELPPEVKLVAVSKFHPIEEVMEAYMAGQRCFGENRPQEFAAKAVQLPQDIEWHFIGHLQTNKLKLVLPYASLVQSIDSQHLLDAVCFWAREHDKTVDILLECHIGQEETKGGLTDEEVLEICSNPSAGVRIRGLMGMASNTDDEELIRSDFARIKALHDKIRAGFPALKDFSELSIGMSGDWRIALEYGATIVRIGTAIFGPRRY